MNLSLSTSWNAHRFENGKDVIREIKSLGFTNLELSFNLTGSMVEDILALEKVGQVKIRSLHNFCPIPEGVERKSALPDYYSLSSLDNTERERALKFTKRTIDTAKRFNAEAVVLHIGRAQIQDKTKALMNLFENGKREEFNALKEIIIKERQEVIGPYFDSALNSLEVLNQFAKDAGIKLGIENRYYFREIPSFEEIEIILDKFSDGNILYWHDVGHAQVWENLGLYSNTGYLEKYSNKLLGVHLHDVKGCDDHRAPLKGEIDFTKFVPFLKKDTIKVMEAHEPSTAEDIQKAAKYLEGIFEGIEDD